MEIILHIGMGKTGTSSIQAALNSDVENLRFQGVDYLGMWFDLIDPSVSSDESQRCFFASQDTDWSVTADSFVSKLEQKKARTGINRYLISNEALFEQQVWVAPFIKALQSRTEVRLIAYARDPRAWLPSAYTQWCIYHKTRPGPVPSFADGGRRLLKMYEPFEAWQSSFGEIFTLKLFKKEFNVVQDFADTIGVRISLPAVRALERIDVSEALLRFIYNNRLPKQALPEEFDMAMRGLRLADSPGISEFANLNFHFGEADSIVAESGHLFSFIDRTFGVNLLQDPSPAPVEVDVDGLRTRALEHLLHITMDQADRIRNLEKVVERLTNSISKI